MSVALGLVLKPTFSNFVTSVLRYVFCPSTPLAADEEVWVAFVAQLNQKLEANSAGLQRRCRLVDVHRRGFLQVSLFKRAFGQWFQAFVRRDNFDRMIRPFIQRRPDAHPDYVSADKTVSYEEMIQAFKERDPKTASGWLATKSMCLPERMLIANTVEDGSDEQTYDNTFNDIAAHSADELAQGFETTPIQDVLPEHSAIDAVAAPRPEPSFKPTTSANQETVLNLTTGLKPRKRSVKSDAEEATRAQNYESTLANTRKLLEEAAKTKSRLDTIRVAAGLPTVREMPAQTTGYDVITQVENVVKSRCKALPKRPYRRYTLLTENKCLGIRKFMQPVLSVILSVLDLLRQLKCDEFW